MSETDSKEYVGDPSYGVKQPEKSLGDASSDFAAFISEAETQARYDTSSTYTARETDDFDPNYDSSSAVGKYLCRISVLCASSLFA